MSKVKKLRGGLYPDFPHIKTLNKLDLAVSDLNKRIKGKIRLLNKFIESASKTGSLDEQEESFYAFSQRISDEILKFQFN